MIFDRYVACWLRVAKFVEITNEGNVRNGSLVSILRLGIVHGIFLGRRALKMERVAAR